MATITEVFSDTSFLREMEGVFRLNAAVQSLFSRLPSKETGFCSAVSFSSMVERISRICFFRLSVPFRESFYASEERAVPTNDSSFFSAGFSSFAFSTRHSRCSPQPFASIWYTDAPCSHSLAVFPDTRKLTWIQYSGLDGASWTEVIA